MNLLQNMIPNQVFEEHAAATAKYKAETRHIAIGLFNEAKHKLLDINNWEKLCGGVAAEFRLTDEKGELLNTYPAIGNLIRIKLPLPANKYQSEFDWVRIEKFESSKDLLKDEEVFGFHVTPVENPFTKLSKKLTSSEITTTFIIMRKSDSIIAMECERTNKTVSFLNKMRKLIIASLTMIGFSEPQWKKLVSGIVKPNFNYA